MKYHALFVIFEKVEKNLIVIGGAFNVKLACENTLTCMDFQE